MLGDDSMGSNLQLVGARFSKFPSKKAMTGVHNFTKSP